MKSTVIISPPRFGVRPFRPFIYVRPKRFIDVIERERNVQTPIKVAALPSLVSLNEIIEPVSKSVSIFTAIFCGLNWFYLKFMREREEN